METDTPGRSGPPAGSQQQQKSPPPNPSFRDLFTFTTWKQSGLLVAGVTAAILSGALKTSMSILFGRIFAVIAQYGSGKLSGADALAEVSSWCVLLVVVGVSGWLVNFAFMFSWVTFSEVQARNIRCEIFQGLLDKDMSWFDGQEDGIASVLVRTQTQTRELQIASSIALGSLSADIATSIANLAVALSTAWRLTLVLLASVPVSAIILSFLSRPVKAAIQAQRQELSRASKYAFSALSAIDLVKVFNGLDHEAWQYLAAIRRSMQQYLIQARGNALQAGYVKFWIDSLFVVGFYYGAVLVGQGLSPGNVLTTFYAALGALQAIEAFVPLYLVLARGASAAQALRSISRELEGGREIYRMKGGRVPRECGGEIEIRNVSFAYPSNPSKIVLQKSSFHFRAGELAFIIGKSGSGKSTLGNLLLKFYEPLSGEILIDGNDIRTLDFDWLRSNVTLIQQSSILFNDSFFMNVAFGHKDPSRVSVEEVKAACETALLQSTIMSLPQGLHTNVGAGGHNLSGGQKQRLALARAKLRDPPILILDEVTSGLDPISRGLIMEAIRAWRHNKTTIIITHEVAQIRDDDFVYVMEDGHVVQEGLSSDLRQQGQGLFEHLLAASDASGTRKSGSSSTGGARSRHGSATYINFSRPLSDASQNGPLVVGSPSPGERLRGVPSSSHDVFNLARTTSQLRLLGVNSRHQMDASATLNTLASATENVPKRGISRMMASLSRQFTFSRAPSRRHSAASSDREQLVDVPQVSPIKTGSIFRLETLGAATKSIRNVSGSRRERYHRKVQARQKADNGEDEEVKPLSLMAIYGTVWPSLGIKEKVFIVAGIFMSVAVAGSVPGFSLVFANLLGALYQSENRLKAGQTWALVLLGIAAAGAIATFLSRYLLEWAAQAWVNNLRMQALNRILRQPKSWFDDRRHSASRIVECLDRNAEEMRNLVGRFAPLLLVVVVMVLISVSWACAISWKLTLVSLASGPFLISATKAYSAVSQKWEERCNRAADEINATVHETFVNVRVVRALTLDSHFSRKHRNAVKNTFDLGLKKAAYGAALFACWQSMFWFMMALIFWYATVLLAIQKEITVQHILQVVNLLVLGLSTASNMLNSVPAISSARATASRLLYYAHLPLESSPETKGTKKLVRPLPIRLNGLSFRYPAQPNHSVLRNMTLSFEAGTSTAIVGPSGCGKSTIAAIILGLHSPETGSESTLTYSSVPFLEVDIAHLRTHMGYVPQTPFLFPSTIAENIAYGLPEGSPLLHMSNIERAAREAGISEFVNSLPEGYDTVVGDGGQALSGGQAQRVCIARALARRPGILVLDEPTSALDAESAEGVRKTIQALLHPPHPQPSSNDTPGRKKRLQLKQSKKGAKGLCVIMVTHSKEMMQMADRIVVVDLGRVAEVGTYEELCEKKGRFAELVSGGEWMGPSTSAAAAADTTSAANGNDGRRRNERASDLPLRRQHDEVSPVTPRWVGTRVVDWDSSTTGPSTGVLSPLASPFSRPSAARRRKGLEEV
ncbi:P-loop containing nucleoside triphosphate hydrolase protein [Xylariaceae sp. FL0594]|nr:P-loop containing nucleoside triphosphate hydrolase protein [Xylariaceae sp. FL0594]